MCGKMGNLTLDNFPVSVRYAFDKLAEPRWMPQVTVMGKADGAQGSAGTTATASSFTIRDYKAGRSITRASFQQLSDKLPTWHVTHVGVDAQTKARLDVESPPPRPHVCISSHPEGTRDPIFGRVLDLASHLTSFAVASNICQASNAF